MVVVLTIGLKPAAVVPLSVNVPPATAALVVVDGLLEPHAARKFRPPPSSPI